MQIVATLIVSDSYPILPITITIDSPAVHAYTHPFGHHILIKYDRYKGGTVYLAFHEGRFDKFKPKMPKISVKYEDTLVPLLTDTEAVYKKINVGTLKEGIPGILSVKVAKPKPLPPAPRVDSQYFTEVIPPKPRYSLLSTFTHSDSTFTHSDSAFTHSDCTQIWTFPIRPPPQVNIAISWSESLVARPFL